MAHRHAQLGIQVGQGFVKQKDFGVAHNGPANGYPLALTARELCGPALQHRVKPQHYCGFVDLALNLGLGHFGVFQTKRHVGVDRHVRVQSIGLKHHGTTSIGCANVVDHFAIDQELSTGGFVQSSDHAQQGGFAATRWAHEDHELAVFDG